MKKADYRTYSFRLKGELLQRMGGYFKHGNKTKIIEQALLLWLEKRESINN